MYYVKGVFIFIMQIPTIPFLMLYAVITGRRHRNNGVDVKHEDVVKHFKMMNKHATAAGMVFWVVFIVWLIN